MSEKFEKIIIDNNDLLQFNLIILLINESLKNMRNMINNTAINFSNEYKKNTIVRNALCNYSKAEVEYMYMKISVVSIYNTFEQYIKKLFNINDIQEFYKEKQYYCAKDNTYYKIVNQCRLLNNSIKHGNIANQLKRKYINSFSNEKDNTIFDNSLNIEIEHIEEFCSGVIHFVEELIDYYKDMGMYEEKS